MEFSELTIRILLLFFPGIITTLLINKLTERDKEETVQFFIRAFIYGLMAYFTLYIIVGIINNINVFLKYIICNCNTNVFKIKLSFLDCLFNGNKNINYLEIFSATCVSVLIALVMTYLKNKNILYKIAKKVKISNKFGNLDVWSHIFNGLEEEVWIIIRDYDLNIMYIGWLVDFSSNHEENELLLERVTVYDNETGKEMYKTDAMYFAKMKENIKIEFIKAKEEEGKINNGNTRKQSSKK